MARFDEKKLSQKSRDAIWMEFCSLLAKLKNADEARYFLSDLLNRQERLMLARRLHIASLLEAGFTYEDIERMLGAGKHTIARVHRWLEFGRDGYRRIIKLIGYRKRHDLRQHIHDLYKR